MADVAGVDLGKQVGPLPIGAWIVVVGAGLGIAFYTRRQAPADPEIVEDTSGTPGVGEGPGWIAVPPPTGGPQVPDPVTNEEWARAAINFLIGQGYDAAIADSAVRKYLEAVQLSIQEWVLMRIALTKLGAPPVPLPPGPGAPPIPTLPKPPSSAPKPAYPKRVTARAGEPYLLFIARTKVWWPKFTLAAMRRMNPGIDRYIRGGRFTKSYIVRVA